MTAGAAPGVRPRLPAQSRAEGSKSLGNVTDPIGWPKPLAWMPCAISSCAKWHSGRTALVARSDRHALQCRTGQHMALVQRVLSMIFKNMDGKLHTFSRISCRSAPCGRPVIERGQQAP
jgi:hypothetical protein